jgi:hypothetical protein
VRFVPPFIVSCKSSSTAVLDFIKLCQHMKPAATATAAGGGAMAAVGVVVERDPCESSFSFSFFSVVLLPLLCLPSLSPSLRRAATAA